MIDLNKLDGKKLYKYFYIYRDYKFDVVDEMPLSDSQILFYRKINLTDNQFKNIEFNYNINKKNFYFIIYNTIDKETNTHSLIFGKEIYNIMEYQNLEGFKNILSINLDKMEKTKKIKEIEQIRKNYFSFRKLVNDLKLNDNIYIISSFILTILGTTYTKDIDCFLFNIEPNNINNILNKTSKYSIDATIYNSRTKEYNKFKKNSKYGSLIYTYRFANEYFNEPDIFHVINDFNYIFIFDNIKFFGLNFYIRRALSRTHFKTYTDLIGLMIKNNYPLIENYKEYMCITNFKNRQEFLIYIFNDYYLNNIFYPSISKLLKEWYKLKFNIDEIKKIYPVCRNLKSIYNRPNIIKISESTRNIVAFNSEFKINILKSVLNNINRNKNINILDVGAGKLNDYFKFWKYNINGNGKYVGLEPSIDSLNIAKIRLEKEKTSIKEKNNSNVILVNGFGDEDWDKYKNVLDYKYDIVVFSFTIHYMIQNINILMLNLKKVIKKETIIVIFYLDGDKVLNELNNINEINKTKIDKLSNNVNNIDNIYLNNIKTITTQDAIIIKDPIYNDVLYYINWFEKINENIIVYFKDVYGLDQGSIETLVFFDFITKKFNKLNMVPIETNNFNSKNYKNYKNNKDNNMIKGSNRNTSYDNFIEAREKVISYQKYIIFKIK